MALKDKHLADGEEIEAKQVRIVALDLPTSWGLATPSDDFTGRMFAAVNAMMLDVLAAVVLVASFVRHGFSGGSDREIVEAAEEGIAETSDSV